MGMHHDAGHPRNRKHKRLALFWQVCDIRSTIGESVARLPAVIPLFLNF